MAVAWLVAISGVRLALSASGPPATLQDGEDHAHCMSLLQTGSVVQAGGSLSHGSLASELEQTGTRARQGGKNTVILMADSRPLFPNGTVPAAAEQAGWLQLAAAMNLQYAQRHGYDFVYVTYTGGEKGWACTATLDGQEIKRHPSWCKLLATRWISQGRSDGMVAFVDSDAFFRDQGRRIENAVETGELTVLPGSPLSAPEAPPPDKRGCSLFTFSNGKYDKIANESKPWNPSETYGNLSNIANGGLLWWTLPLDETLLATWWKTSRANLIRDWEQASLNIEVLASRPESVCTFVEDPFDCRDYLCHQAEFIADMLETTMDKQTYREFQKIFTSNFSETMHALRDHHQYDLTQEDMNSEAVALEQMAAPLPPGHNSPSQPPALKSQAGGRCPAKKGSILSFLFLLWIMMA